MEVEQVRSVDTKREFVPIEERHNPKIEKKTLNMETVKKLMNTDSNATWKTRYNNDYMRLQVLAGEMTYSDRRIEVIRTPKHKWILKELEKFPKSAKILEVACGEGLFPSELSKRGYKNLSGCDISGDAIKVAMKNNKKINFEEMDIETSTYQHEYFDVVICQQLIEHMPDPIRVVEQLFRVVKKGGLVIVSTPIEKNLDDPLHLHHFDYYDMMHMFEEFTDDFKIYQNKKLTRSEKNNVFIVLVYKRDKGDEKDCR